MNSSGARAEVGSAYPLVRLIAGLGLLTVGGSAMSAGIMVIEPAATEFDTGRGAASLPYACFMLGFGLGGVLMGHIADRIGVLLPAVIGSTCLPAGLLACAQAESLGAFSIYMGGLCGLFGASITFAPLVADISHWFTARRGLAIGIVISGTYVAGAIWPPVLQHLFDEIGWRATFRILGVLSIPVMLPLSMLLYRKAPIGEFAAEDSNAAHTHTPLGFSPRSLQCILCAAGVGCCVAMAMPQVHIVPFVTDLGYPAARGAEMLAMMLGFGIVSRLISGWFSDHVGGIKTLLVGAILQALVIVAFLGANTLTGLYVASIAFGLSQGGIIPSYAVIIRAFLPADEAGWRIGTVLLFTVTGMAIGGWLAGVLYDLTGTYTASFVNAVAFNVLTVVIAATLVKRARRNPALAP